MAGQESIISQVAPDRHAQDREPGADPVVCLYQGRDCEVLSVNVDPARRGAGTPLEFLTDHAGTTADVALGHWP